MTKNNVVQSLSRTIFRSDNLSLRQSFFRTIFLSDNLSRSIHCNKMSRVWTPVRRSVRRAVGPSVRRAVGPSVTRFFLSRLWEKMVGNDWENSPNAPDSSESLPNHLEMSQCPKMSNSDAWLSERTCFPFILFLSLSFSSRARVDFILLLASNGESMGHVRFCALLYYVPISYATFPRTLLRLQLITTFAPCHYICMCIVTFPF